MPQIAVAVKRRSLQVPNVSGEQDANIATDVDSFGSSPVHKAAQNGHLEVIKWLIQRGAAVDAIYGDDWTPLFHAAYYGHLEVVEWLIEHGAATAVDQKGRDGWTLLTAAAFDGHLEVVKFLVERGADLDDRSAGGWSALDWAAWKGHLEVVKYLVEGSASRYVTLAHDETAQSTSERHRHHGVATHSNKKKKMPRIYEEREGQADPQIRGDAPRRIVSSRSSDTLSRIFKRI